MHRETAMKILRDKGRDAWEISVLVAFLSESGALDALPDDASHEDVDEAARVVMGSGAAPLESLGALIEKAREHRLNCQMKHLDDLIESLAASDNAAQRDEIAQCATHLAMVESQIARVGVPQDLVVPVAGLLQATDSEISQGDSPEQVRRAIHSAARRLLQSHSN